MLLVLQIAITVWIGVISVMDHRDGRIPNVLTAPLFLGVGGYRLFQGVQGVMQGTQEWMRLLLLLVYGVIFILWMLHFIGGGDAKFLMALYALFPSMEFTTVLAFILLILIIPLLLWEMRGKSIGEVYRGFRNRVVTGEFLPTEEELQTRGRRYAWTFAIPALVYTWIYWDKF